MIGRGKPRGNRIALRDVIHQAPGWYGGTVCGNSSPMPFEEMNVSWQFVERWMHLSFLLASSGQMYFIGPSSYS